jgi:hypothetical protein
LVCSWLRQDQKFGEQVLVIDKKKRDKYYIRHGDRSDLHNRQKSTQSAASLAGPHVYLYEFSVNAFSITQAYGTASRRNKSRVKEILRQLTGR